MAATKKTTAKKPAAATRSAEVLKHEKRKRQLWSIVLFAIGILLICFALIGNKDAEQPSAWDFIHTFFRGLFGISVFLIGPVIIYAAIMLSADKGKSTILGKLIQLIFVIVLICSAMQIYFVGSVGAEGDDFFGCFGTVYTQGTTLFGGGLVGMPLSYLLLMFGRIGASIIITLIIFVVIMLMANVTLLDFFRMLGKPIKKLFGFAKKKREEYKEESEIVRAEYEKKAEERKQLKAEEKPQPKPVKLDKKENEKLDSFNQLDTMVRNTVSNLPEESADELPNRRPNPFLEQIEDTKNFTNELKKYNSDEFNGVQLTSESPETKAAAETATEVKPVEEAPAEPAPEVNPIEKAITDYQKEIEKTAAKSPAEPEKVIDTIVKTDEDGQGRFEEIISSAAAYKLPPIELLNDIVPERADADIAAELEANSTTLVETLKSFGVMTKVIGVCRGPSVTRYELQPAAGVKISKITGLIDDISLNLATAGVRIEAPIPNKAAVGVEVPNKKTDTVPFRALVDSKVFRENKSKLGAVIGKDISGETILADISKMPHILIAGTTGSGKSVCVNSIIMSILYRSTPDEVRLLMIDPKAVEFMIYNGIPHLLIPVVTDPKKAASALAWAVNEMLKRYKLFSDNNVRDIFGYNSLVKGNNELEPMPQIVIFIDELADLMMASPGEVEDSICRLAQMARAAGMHLVIATQRPSVNVVTGVIKANIPSRIALKVASQVDSRTIIDGAGAEKLLGKGDMLYFPVGMPKPMRVQGCWVSDKEVERVVDFIKNSFTLSYDDNVIEEIERHAELAASSEKPAKAESGDIDVQDDKLDEAIEAVIEAGQASTSYLQRKLKLGYGRAARLIDIMEEMGVVGPFEGAKPRQVVMTKQEWYERKLNNSK